jgi:Caspase domain
MRFAHRFTVVLCAAAACLGASTSARAETRRVAVVVGNNAGGSSDKPLHYAEEDSVKVADVLAQLGDVHAENLFLLKGLGRKDLQQVLAQVEQRVAEYRQRPEDRTVLIFYYSGHSDEEALELGTDRVAYGELRTWLAATQADVRVVIVDGCKSGALVQSKGGTRAPPFEIKLSDQLDATGEAMLTSSAADELALESREIRGSFFTHHFVSGLRGAADSSGDGRITLSEAYQYAFDRTLTATAASGVRQHPGYDYRLSGKGELVLTEVTQPSATLELPEGFERALVSLVRRDQVLVELGSGPARRVALAPGEYALRLWKGTVAYAARIGLAAGDEKKVGWGELQPVAAPQVTSKGHAGPPELEGLEGLSPEAQAQYEGKYFSVVTKPVLSSEPKIPGLASLPISIYRGSQQRKTGQEEFFLTVGRPDLAQAVRGRHQLKVGLVAGGVALAVAGPLLTAVLVYGNCLGGQASASLSASEARTCTIGTWSGVLGSIAAGGLLALIGIFSVSPNPVDVDEVRRLADQYNGGLRHSLEADPPPRARADVPPVTFGLAPAVFPGGGGLVLGARF